MREKIASLEQQQKKFDENSRSKKTILLYESDLKTFRRWCDEMGLEHSPTTTDVVRMYIVELDNRNKKPATIQRAIKSIRQNHIYMYQDNPITEAVGVTLRGLLRMRGINQDKKSAMTQDKLVRIVSYIPHTFIGIRDIAIILTGWTAALRRSEICSLKLGDLEYDEKGIIANIRRSKTDQFGNGRLVGLPFLDQNHKMCAARAIQKWIKSSKIQNKLDPIFCSVSKLRSGFFERKTGGQLCDRQVCRIVKQYSELAGYNPSDFGAHSLRSGLATTLAADGIEERRIMKITGHKSLKNLREYIERGELFDDHPVARLSW